uniref:Spermatogenesis associated 22 n=1 Tax=Mastacembelus armatus TaxID=205130 RepID=A0A3Q3LFY0_9TELE
MCVWVSIVVPICRTTSKGKHRSIYVQCKKRNRVPLTSAPSENEFFSHSEYMTSSDSEGCCNIFHCKCIFIQVPMDVSRPLAHFLVTRKTTSGTDKVFDKKLSLSSMAQETFPVKPAIENSLRILTAVIDGMRHWSQFKDKVSYLFEIFATLDSAVTLGRHGAKNFLMRNGKTVVQCVFYENKLPRLIRGQLHRCVGNYDRSRDVLMCVSIRPGLPSELQNAQEAVKACDAEMRALVKSLNEV